MNNMRIRHLSALVPLVLAVMSCGGSGGYGGTSPAACTPDASTVCLTSANTFNPVTITIAKGSSLTWNNSTGVTHNVTFSTPGAPANIPNFSSGTPSLVFPTAGTFNYNCTIHGISMHGTVVVQ